MSVVRWNQKQLLGRKVFWLLDFSFAGKTFRLSTTELDVYDSTDLGEWLHYSDGLSEVTMGQELDLFNESFSPVSVPLEFLLPEAIELIAKGHDLTAATGELSKWIEGTDYTERKTILVGLASDPEYGDALTTIQLSLEENIFDDLTTIPGPTALVSSATVNTQYLDPQNDVGLAYPLIIGQPGKVDTFIAEDGWVTGSQGVWRVHTLAAHQLVIAGHPVQCNYVYMTADATPSGALKVFKVNQTHDLAGRLISVIDSAVDHTVFAPMPNTGAPSLLGIDCIPATDPSFQTDANDSAGIFVGWLDADDATGRLGGFERDGKLVREAGDVLELILSYSQMRIDYGRIQAIKPMLKSFKIDVAIDEQVKPWEWLRANLLPILPVSLVNGPNGLYFIYWNFEARAEDAIVTLDGDADPAIQFADRISTDRGQIKNQFTLDYALSVRTGSYCATAQLNGEVQEGHAVAELHCYTGSVFLTSVAGGAKGNGILVQVVNLNGSGSFSAIDSLDGKQVVIGLQNGVRTGQQIADRINRDSALIRAHATSNATSINYVYSGPGALQETYTSFAGIKAGQGGGSLICAESVRRYKGRVSKTGIVEDKTSSICIYDSATAALVLQWKAAAFALATRTVEVLVEESRWDWLERGDVVLLNKTSMGLNNAVALVEAIEYADDDMVAFRFRLIENPGRDRSIV